MREETDEEHKQKCQELSQYWGRFYAVFDLPEYNEARKEYDAAGEEYFKHLKQKTEDKDHSLLRAWNIKKEEFQCKIIAERYSSTHNWIKRNFNIMKCKDCGYIGSQYKWREIQRPPEERNDRVDGCPHYDTEVNLIHYTCAELQERYNERKENGYRRCKQCGVWGCPYWDSGKYKI